MSDPSESNRKKRDGDKRKRTQQRPESSSSASKRAKVSSSAGVPSLPATVAAAAQPVDFPRGGGSGLTPLEYRETVREARAEAARDVKDEDLFVSGGISKGKGGKKQNTDRGPDGARVVDGEGARERKRKLKQKENRDKQNAKKKKSYVSAKEQQTDRKRDEIRVEHLSYKRLRVGSRLLCTVLAVHPLALVLSLPNQLLGHVPITNISTIFTERLQQAAQDSDSEGSDDEDEDEDDDGSEEGSESQSDASPRKSKSSSVPELRELYQPGQWLIASVTVVHSSGTLKAGGTSGVHGREGGEYEQASRRVELSLDPAIVNDGVTAADLAAGFILPATVKSREDRGHVLDAGIDGLSGGFLALKDSAAPLRIGQVVMTAVTRGPKSGRAYTASMLPSAVGAATLADAAPPTRAGLLPGLGLSVLITAVSSAGLVVKLWGMFDGTIDRSHLPPQTDTNSYKPGQKIAARILWDLGGGDDEVNESDGTSKKLGLSAASQVLQLGHGKETSLPESYPIGTTLSVTVVHCDSDWGLVCTLDEESLASGFVHISRVADEHIDELSGTKGAFKVGSTHRARVVGHALTDRIVLLSLQPTVLGRDFMRVSEVHAGDVVKAKVKKISEKAIFLDLNGSVDGIVFSQHWSDVILKKPEKKFKVGDSVRARVLYVDPSKNRISLTLKKTLVGSDLPVVASLQDARVGVVTHATVSQIHETGFPRLVVDFYGNVRAVVPLVEVSETTLAAVDLRKQFFEGKVVKVRLMNVDYETGRINASVRQALPSFLARINVDAVDIGERVEGQVAAVHQDVVVLSLHPSKVRALLPLSVVAKQRGEAVDAVREALEEGETLSALIVLQKNAEKGIVIVGDADQQRKGAKGAAKLAVGQVVRGRVSRILDQLSVQVDLPGGCRGRLHITDCADNWTRPATVELPSLQSELKVVILTLKNGGLRADVSIRGSVIFAAGEVRDPPPSSDSAIEAIEEAGDPAVSRLAELAVGSKCRGVVRAVAAGGLFVDLGRKITARVKISEMFDDFVEHWKDEFDVGQVVSGTVLSVDADVEQIEFSLRSDEARLRSHSKGKRTQETGPTISAFSKGDKISGTVVSIAEYGLFVRVDGSKVSGLCHRTELSDSKSADAIRAFAVGDKVKAIVLAVDREKSRISFGLKPSYFTSEDFEADEGDQESGMESDGVEQDDQGASSDDEDDEEAEDESDDEDANSEGYDSDEEILIPDRLNLASKAKSNGRSSTQNDLEAAPLELMGGFSWSASNDPVGQEDDSGSSSDESDQDVRTKLKKSRKTPGLARDITGDLAGKVPESVTDFERVLLGSPNSSYLWIRFMSFHLQISDVDAARDVARRALKVISFREDEERLNVWTALLNLESAYGGDVQKVFVDAVQANDGKEIHRRMADIHEQCGRLGDAEEVWRKAVKRYGSSDPDTWLSFYRFYLRSQRSNDARALVPRSLQSLDKRDHLKVLTGYALSEYKLADNAGGDIERGRVLFEGLISAHPKRLDLWWQYIDQEAAIAAIEGPGSPEQVRALFERVLSSPHIATSKHRGRSILKKWLSFEKRIGDTAGEQSVLDQAKQFVERLENGAKRAADAPGDEESEEEGDDDDDEE